MKTTTYTPRERRALLDGLRAGRSACPRCGAPTSERAIEPRDDVSYVRRRVWLACSACHRHAVFDRSALEPPA